MLVADAKRLKDAPHLLRAGGLRWNRIGFVYNVACPVEVDRAGDVSPLVLLQSAKILRALHALGDESRPDLAAHVHDAYRGVASGNPIREFVCLDKVDGAPG